MAYEEVAQEQAGLWKPFARLRLLLDPGLCTPELLGQAECVEHCRVRPAEDSDECEDPDTARSADMVQIPAFGPSSYSGRSNQFTLHWADLQGMQDKPVSLSGKMHHSVLPLTSNGQNIIGGVLPAPRFKRSIPLKAYLYKPDTSDAIDVELHKHLQSLSQDELNVLGLRRLETGKYEIDGRHVHVYRGGVDGMQYLVHEDDVGAGIADMPLRAYINLVANVTLSLHRRGVSPSFNDAEASTATKADENDNRYRAMRLACTQAELRESSKYYRTAR